MHLRKVASVEAFRTLSSGGIHTTQLQTAHQRLQALSESVDEMVSFAKKVDLVRYRTKPGEQIPVEMGGA